MKPTFKKLFAASLCAAMLAIPNSSFALTLTPTMIVMEGRDRYADLNVINNGDETMSYSVFWRFFRQNDVEGNYLDSASSITDFDLTQNVVFTPKRVSVEPNEMQKVRIGLRLKGEPPAPGDYRAHLEVREKPDASTPSSSVDDKPSKMTVGIGVNVGFSIPVIYRVGEPDVRGEIENVSTQINKTGQIELTVPVKRVPADSKFGLLGNLKVFHNGELVGEQTNANIFPEVKSRDFRIALKTPALKSGSLKIVYGDFHAGDKQQIYAEKTVPVGQ